MNQGGEATGGTKKAMKSITMDKGLSTWSCDSKPNSQEPGNIGKAKVKRVMHEKPDLNQGYRLTETHQRFGLIYLLKPNKDRSPCAVQEGSIFNKPMCVLLSNKASISNY